MIGSSTKYERLGADYHWRWAQTPAGPYPRWVRKVIDHFPARGAGHTVLDVGCGDGYPASLLSERGYAVHGVDPLLEPLSVAQERVPEGTFTEEYPDLTFDYVLALDSIEHMDDVEPLARAVQRCRRYALISTPPIGDKYGRFVFDLNAIIDLFPSSLVFPMYADDVHQLFRIVP